jgi:hypothetical protein
MTGIGHPEASHPQREDLPGGAADPFPRDAVTEMVGRAERKRERREALQAWALGLGMAIVALGVPSERLWGNMQFVRQVAELGQSSFGILAPLARAITALTPLSPERVCYLLAALSWGLCLPALRATLRSIGFPHGVSLAAASIVVVSPGLWLGATSPLDFMPGVLAACLLARTLFRTDQSTRHGYQWRATLMLFLAFLLGGENLLLLPAVALAISSHPSKQDEPRWMAAFTLLIVMIVSVTILVSARDGGWTVLFTDLLAGGRPSIAALPWWLLWYGVLLGTGAYGVYVLLLGGRAPEELPPPRWVVPWCVVALVPVVGGSLATGPAGGFLVPMAAIGVADGLFRIERRVTAERLAAGLMLTQLSLTIVVSIVQRMTDPLDEWRRAARANLEPTDLVLTRGAERAYLLAHRWGLERLLLDGTGPAWSALRSDAEDALAHGRRVVLDAWTSAPDEPGGEWPRELEAALADLEVWTLTPAGFGR